MKARRLTKILMVMAKFLILVIPMQRTINRIENVVVVRLSIQIGNFGKFLVIIIIYKKIKWRSLVLLSLLNKSAQESSY